LKPVVLHPDECRKIVAQDPFAGTALGLVPTPAGDSPGEAVDPAAVLGDGTGSAFIPESEGAGGSKPFAVSQSTASSNFYSTTQSSESDITSIEKNSVSVGASLNVDIPDICTVSASASFTYGETSTNGQSLITTTTNNQTETTTQNFRTSATLAGGSNPVNVVPYLDPRFDTLMFQSGVGNPDTTVPVITSVNPLSLTLATALAKNEHLASGATLKLKTGTDLPRSLAQGTKLALPSGQVLVTSKTAASAATSLSVEAAIITTAVPIGARIGPVGSEVVHGGGFSNGPIGVSFCTNSTGIPSCTAGTNIGIGTGGQLIYATTNDPPGSNVAVVVQSQSGSGNYGVTFPPSEAEPYFVPYGAPPVVTKATFTGSSLTPTITVTGTGFGLKNWLGPPSKPSVCGGTDTTGSNYGQNFNLVDFTTGLIAGVGPIPLCNQVGLHILSYSPTKIVFTPGSTYPATGHIDAGDSVAVDVLGTGVSATVSY